LIGVQQKNKKGNDDDSAANTKESRQDSSQQPNHRKGQGARGNGFGGHQISLLARIE
jgi:hypothetical protein